MLVLRRRAQEVIVFDGGLSLTVLEVGAHRAWLGFEAPSVDGVIAIAALEVVDDAAVIGIRSPSTIDYGEHSTTIGIHPGPIEPGGPTLSLGLAVGERLEFKGLALELVSLQNKRATLGIEVPCLSARISVTVQSITGAEARIGIEAPEDLRVYRKELWLELLGANQAAAGWTSSDLDELVPPTES